MIIGISGKAGAGKDKAADILCHNFNICKIAFADEIKRSLMRWYGWEENVLWGDSENRNKLDVDRGFVIRDGLTTIGDAARNLYLKTWVDFTLSDAELILKFPGKYNYYRTKGIYSKNCDSYTGVVIPDGRRANELLAIKERQGLLIRIKRNDNNLSEAQKSHPSESEQDFLPDCYFDYVVENNSTLENFEKRILEIGQEIFPAYKAKQLSFGW